MLSFIFDHFILTFLTVFVLASILGLHYLLFKEYRREEKIQTRRLQDMEHLVTIEVNRSKALSYQNDKLSEIKSKTQERLEVIKLQVEALKNKEKG